MNLLNKLNSVCNYVLHANQVITEIHSIPVGVFIMRV